MGYPKSGALPLTQPHTTWKRTNSSHSEGFSKVIKCCQVKVPLHFRLAQPIRFLCTTPTQQPWLSQVRYL
eukprot:scaffold624_cov206-Alexandrium_tamarense.AAC.11